MARAIAALSDMRVKLEQYFQDNRTYVGACAAGTVAPLPPAADNPDFTISCPTLTATAFVVQADGDGATASGKMSGFLYNVNQSNQKSTTTSSAVGKASRGWTGNTSCWVVAKGGGC
ncbi:MAG: type IV pilin protein [Rhodocyclaceae bacterium]|nr:type IV pilin protein [Rhodocyclaceae bacterium]